MDEILRTQRELARNIILLDALDELDIRHEDDVLALSAEFRDVIQRESEIREQAKQKPALLDRLYGNITDLYVDRYKFKGVNVRNSISSLLQVLDKYDLKALIEFFDTQKNAESA